MTALSVDSARTLRGVESLSAGITQAMALALRTAVKVAEESARSTDKFMDRRPVNSNDEGHVGTRGSIRGEVTGWRGFVQAGGAARFLEYGTAPHIIRARNAKMLRFVQNGTIVFRKWVRHPGTSPRPFMHEARNAGEQAAAYGAEEYINYAIARAS